MSALSAVAGKGVAKKEAERSEALQVLTFWMHGEMFAVGILQVKEIIEYGQVTEIPLMPAFIRGVINLRGSVVPVVDLGARFGYERQQIGRRSCIVIVEMRTDEGSHDMGMVVDSVSEVLEVAAADIEPPPSFGAKIRADFIQGMSKINGKFVILLNTERVLSVDEMALLLAARAQGNALADIRPTEKAT